MNGIFVNNLSSPPLCKNHPPMAGAIYWARSLFYRIKHTIIRFQEVEELLASERGKEVRRNPVATRLTSSTYDANLGTRISTAKQGHC